MIRWLTKLLFPPKCVLCRKLLQKQETDLCRSCREDAPEFVKSKRKGIIFFDFHMIFTKRSVFYEI